MGNTSLQPERPAQPSAVQKQMVPLELCGTKPMDVVPAEHYFKQLGKRWIVLWNILGMVWVRTYQKVWEVLWMFPLAGAHWTFRTAGVKSGLIVCAQPRRILARELCNRVRENRRMKGADKSVGYAIARESLKDDSSKVLYCMEAVVVLMMQSHLQLLCTSKKTLPLS